ncbi:hypothetical protein [Microbacterium halophytorum]|uniref:hypothetical protein n=1 Tax=Microbacterium halophytorum TaxID=2067568 RepID=UPI00131A3C96|nr:hypothetical protein [Microbacterium halophytorum]
MVKARVKETAADEFIAHVGTRLNVSIQPRTVFDVLVNDQVVATVDRDRMREAGRKSDGFEKMRDRDKAYRDAFLDAVREDAAEALINGDPDGEQDVSSDDEDSLMHMRRVADAIKRVQAHLQKTIHPVIEDFDDPHTT